MKKISVALLLVISTFTGITSAHSAITCPNGTVISTQDPTKCISSTVAYIPTDRIATSICPENATVTLDNKCRVPGYWVAGGTYQGSPRYVFWCSGGVAPSSDGYCHTPLNPPIVNSQYSPGSYSCPSYYFAYLSGNRCNGSVYGYLGTSISATFTYPACDSGYVRNGDNCQKTITEILSSPTQYIDGYDCNGTISASQTCTTTGFLTADSITDPAVAYTGTCTQWLIFNKTTGLCTPYVFSPDTPITETIYKCIATGWATTPTTSYYNYDASVVAPFGKSITCTPTQLAPTQDLRDGVYLCSSINLISGNIYYYASDVDATGLTATVQTNCDFSVTELTLLLEEEPEYNFSTNDTCDNLVTFAQYMTCLATKYA